MLNIYYRIIFFIIIIRVVLLKDVKKTKFRKSNHLLKFYFILIKISFSCKSNNLFVNIYVNIRNDK